MAFGSPRPILTIINLAFIVGGVVLLWVSTTWIRWLGIPLLLWGGLVGLMMGCWTQLLPGTKPVGRRKEADSVGGRGQ